MRVAGRTAVSFSVRPGAAKPGLEEMRRASWQLLTSSRWPDSSHEGLTPGSQNSWMPDDSLPRARHCRLLLPQFPIPVFFCRGMVGVGGIKPIKEIRERICLLINPSAQNLTDEDLRKTPSLRSASFTRLQNVFLQLLCSKQDPVALGSFDSRRVLFLLFSPYAPHPALFMEETGSLFLAEFSVS